MAGGLDSDMKRALTHQVGVTIIPYRTTQYVGVCICLEKLAATLLLVVPASIVQKADTAQLWVKLVQ
jgi:hypothetical protein